MNLRKILSKDGLYWIAYYAIIATHIDRWVPDKVFLKIQYRCICGRPLNLKTPQTYNEKLQWLKLYDRKAEYTQMVDKYAVKKYVSDRIGEDFIIPTIGVWDKPEEIDWNILPKQFVLKCTHDSGGLVICSDKSKLDKRDAMEGLRCSLRRDYYRASREWPYKNVPHRIIAEKYLESTPGSHDLHDYKFFCFGGEVKLIELDYGRFGHHGRNLYTPEWQRIDAILGVPSLPNMEFARPDGLEKAMDAAKILSSGLPHVRVDFFIIDGHVYFGELTFYHASGFNKITPESFEKQMGDWIKLP